MRAMNRIPGSGGDRRPQEGKERGPRVHKLGVTTVALIDTDCNPDDVDLPIPANDDGIRSIETVLRHIADAIIQGRGTAEAYQKSGEKAAAEPAAGRSKDRVTKRGKRR
jgi:small subunit ribosomal protein S2